MVEDEEGEGEPQEPMPYFSGVCTCEHSEDEHSWGACEMDGCPCEAGWEE